MAIYDINYELISNYQADTREHKPNTIINTW